MTVKEAREAIKPPLKFGDARQIEARKILAVVGEFEAYRRRLPKDQVVGCPDCDGKGQFKCGVEGCENGQDEEGKLCVVCLGTTRVYCVPCNGGGTMLLRSVDVNDWTDGQLMDWIDEMAEVANAH